MQTETLPTKFLPAEKAAAADVKRQAVKLVKAGEVFKVFDGRQDFCLVLNRQRQAVFLNRAFRDFLAEHDIEDPIGLRPGNLLGCAHANDTESGCGTTEFCRRCGSAVALGEALRGEEAVRECRILAKKSGGELDLRVSVQPFNYDGEDFLLMSVLDIGAEKRREALERLLFKSVLETAGGVRGLIDLALETGAGNAPQLHAAEAATGQLLEQVLAQRDLAAAERGDLLLKLTEVRSAPLLEELAGLLGPGARAQGKQLEVAGDSEDVTLRTDRTLLTRVLLNLAGNALEAECAPARITLACRAVPGGAVFTVRNPGCMPEEARLQVFQRSFSTKGTGRGLGTYSARLFTEKYLGGSLSFNTGATGTEFRAQYPAAL